MKKPFQGPFMALTRRISAVLMSLLFLGWTSSMSLPQPVHAVSVDSGSRNPLGGLIDCSDSGILVAMAKNQSELGRCPLKHTDVKVNISGYVARVTVRQQFHNSFSEKIEAIYTFPLPSDAAVDDMTMKVGNRVIKGSIKKKEEAREVYEAARARGNVASLLDQERPNIFTQSVANIEPGENIDIEIKYVNLLKFDDGAFTFAFPTVVGPRFIPGHTSEGRTGTGLVQNTDMVPDASKITPPMAERTGHDISIEMNINAGVPIQDISSKLHQVDIQKTGANTAHIKLKDSDKIPNKDFVATWNVAQDSVQSGYLTHREGNQNDGFFTLMMIPPRRVSAKTVQPKEMVFVIDCSGSQRGMPIQKAKETMEYILEHMNPQDTFQIITFNGGVQKFPPAAPEVCTASMRSSALNFIHGLQAQGGTWMAPAVEAACALPNEDHRLRIITFMTDGFVGNDFQIISMIKKYRNQARWFSFGTGNSVNRFLIDNIAKEGGGEADYVLLNSSAEEVGKKFYDRISSPVLTDLKMEIDGLETKEVFPKELADLWAQKPLYFTGRYLHPGKGKVVLTGYSGGKPYKQVMEVDFPAKQDNNDVLPSIWARAKVERLMSEDWLGMQTGGMNKELRDEIVGTALKYHIMSQYTSFVAVEEERKTSGGAAKSVTVPVEIPQGVQAEQQRQSAQYNQAASSPAPVGMSGALPKVRPSGANTGVYGSPQAMSGGIGYGMAGGGSYVSTGNLRGVSVSGRLHAYGGGGSGGGSGGGGLPPTNMGKFVHQPGDNQYQPGGQVAQKPSLSNEGTSAPPPPAVSYGGNHANLQKGLEGHDGYAHLSQLQGAINGTIGPSAGANKKEQAKDTNAFQVEPSVIAQHHRRANVEHGFKSKESAEAKEKAKNEKGDSDASIAIDKLSLSSPKLDKNLRSLLEQIAKGQKTSRLIEGQLFIRVELASAPDAALLEKLKNLGFDLVKSGSKFVIGRITPDSLSKLEKLSEVTLIKLG